MARAACFYFEDKCDYPILMGMFIAPFFWEEQSLTVCVQATILYMEVSSPTQR